MSLNVWNKPSGYSFGVYQERSTVDLLLPVDHLITSVYYAVISGKLPLGLQIVNNHIFGTPYEVPRDTTFTFCIRASKTINSVINVSDRTFNITIQGSDPPIILTPAGLLEFGQSQQYFIMDNTFVDYQIDAVDTDTAAGQHLSFFISSRHGMLPPGLSLSLDGRITGYVQSVTSIKPEDGTGTYDNGVYDAGPYDFAYIKASNGYDYYAYDYAIYDYQTPHRQPRAVNRHYEFTVTVSDGESLYQQRTFQILVVSDSQFRVSSETLLSSVGMFTADVSYLRKPVWLTPSDLGTYRTNNYITLLLDVFDVDLIYYSILDITALPAGLSFDEQTGEVFGSVPFQPAVSKHYSFTVIASRHGEGVSIASASRTFTMTILGEVNSEITWETDADMGYINAGYQSALAVYASNRVSTANTIYKIVDGGLPPGLSLALTGEISGKATQFTPTFIIDHNTTVIDNNRTTFKQDIENKSLLVFDFTSATDTHFDNNATTFDHQFTFTVAASDQQVYSTVLRTFNITVHTPNRMLYSNIYTKPLLTLNHRLEWYTFSNDPTIFTPSSIYRPADAAFGVQSDLSMLIYAGIETRNAELYFQSIMHGVKKKRFQFGQVKKAISMPIGTTNPLYEVVYVTMIDPTDSNVGYMPTSITTNNRTYYTNTSTNWQTQLSTVGSTKRNYLPLWMQSIQPETREELGFILAIPLCFCKVGTGNDIILNIKYSKFNFSLLDYTIDRFIIDSTAENNDDKYIIFNNDRDTI